MYFKEEFETALTNAMDTSGNFSIVTFDKCLYKHLKDYLLSKDVCLNIKEDNTLIKEFSKCNNFINIVFNKDISNYSCNTPIYELKPVNSTFELVRLDVI